MELGLIKPRAHLDYLPPKARLLISTCDQPSKTKLYKPVIHLQKKQRHQTQAWYHKMKTLALHH